ncbi:hypothetical protein DSL92_00295 [Billgrantia gudaonensis]|uniref:Twin-arginine translocation signal domain-containing protein n=1 Tax=Billgrantia gudaonensis TaxID=376427 RepID=A0A3S0QSB4_9GAMM|nr:hypothetical protein DSL92_00295 [Halomonas gudaonensis]
MPTTRNPQRRRFLKQLGLGTAGRRWRRRARHLVQAEAKSAPAEAGGARLATGRPNTSVPSTPPCVTDDRARRPSPCD